MEVRLASTNLEGLAGLVGFPMWILAAQYPSVRIDAISDGLAGGYGNGGGDGYGEWIGQIGAGFYADAGSGWGASELDKTGEGPF